MSNDQNYIINLSMQSPWPGLRAFGEGDQEFFFGREHATKKLFNLVQHSSVVVLYGQSGLGKTSLLQAGLFPMLKSSDYLPVLLRFDHSKNALPLAEQIKSSLITELNRADISAPRPGKEETLWEYFHRHDVDFWGRRNRLLTPVIVFDQFEEVFTLGQKSEEASERVTRFAEELESLIEHRPPDSVRKRLEENPDDALKYDLQRESVKFLISLREDFLPQLDTWRTKMPSLLPHRFRLERMTGEQALDVVECAGRNLVKSDVANEIVDFVSASQRKRFERIVEQRDVEPALLSVVCDELNQLRIARGQERITADLLTEEREGIIQSFYERAFEGVDSNVRNWIEKEVLTASGYRDRAALEDAIKIGLPETDFNLLVNRRILHREEREGIVWLELTHDLLTDPALESRTLREKRIQAEEAKRREVEYKKELKRSRRIAFIFSILLLVAGGFLYWALISKNEADNERERANIEKRKAEESFLNAVETADAVGVDLLDYIQGSMAVPSMSVIRIIDIADSSYQKLSGRKVTTGQIKLRQVRFLSQAAEVFYQIGFIKEGIDHAQQALELFTTLKKLDVSQDTLDIVYAKVLYALGKGYFESGKFKEAKENLEEAIQRTEQKLNRENPEAIRIYALSQIELGELQNKKYQFTQAANHFENVLAFIEKYNLKNDIALYWKAQAYLGLGNSQTKDKQSEINLKNALNTIHILTKKNEKNYRWKRLLAKVSYIKAYKSWSLGEFEKAEKLFKESKTVSNILVQYDPSNLDWQLSLAQSNRGLGKVYKSRQEWDLAKSTLDNAISIKVLLDTTWINARYLHAALIWSVGDYWLKKYERSQKKETTDLDSAKEKFEEAYKIFKKNAQNVPEYLEFRRGLALTIGYMGRVFEQQGNYKSAIQYFDDAINELQPLENIAKNYDVILKDKAYYYGSRGYDSHNLKEYREAISDYKKAIKIRKSLLNNSPTHAIYYNLAVVQSNLSIIFLYSDDNFKELNEASKYIRLSASSIQKALEESQENVDYLHVKSKIYLRLSDLYLELDDQVESWNALKIAIEAVWKALQKVHADKNFLDTLEKLKKKADTIRSKIKDNLIIKEIDKMKRDKDPLQFLNSQHTIWTMQPMMKGAWRTLTDNEKKKIEDDLIKTDHRLNSYKISKIRKLKLDFYNNATLFEANVLLDSNKQGFIDYVKRGTETILLDGTTPIITLNQKALPKLGNEDQAEAYFRFFVGALQGDGGRFVLVEESDDLNWLFNIPENKREEILSKVQPLTLEKVINGGWQATVTIQYNNSLFNASFRMYRDGYVEMAQDIPFAGDLDLFIDYLSDGIRERFTPEEIQLKRLMKDPEDSVALKKLSQFPNHYYSESRWREAVDAQKLLVNFIKDNSRLYYRLPNEYLDLSWYQLFARDFEGSLKSSKKGIKLDSNYLPLYTNYAHALLFLGQTKDAEAIYLQPIGELVFEDALWTETILTDFDLLEANEITHPEIAPMRVKILKKLLEQNPEYDFALKQLPYAYYLNKQWKEAVKAQKNYIDHNKDKKSLEGAYVNLSWYQLFAKDFVGAFTTAGKNIDAVSIITIDSIEGKRLLSKRFPEIFEENWRQLTPQDWDKLFPSPGPWTQRLKATLATHIKYNNDLGNIKKFTTPEFVKSSMPDICGTDISKEKCYKTFLNKLNEEKETQYLPLETNLAHALLFLNMTEEAIAIYQKHKGESIGGKLWQQIIIEDFYKLEKAGITHSEIPNIRSLLQEGITKVK